MKSRVLIAVMSAAVLLNSGCASLRFMSDKTHLPKAFEATCQRLGIVPTRFILVVDVPSQTLSVFEQNKFVKTLPCSTSRFGTGQIEGSNRTPLGLHRVAEKIGGGEAAGTVFNSRLVVGHNSQPELADAKITTRILWLDGLETGFNAGGRVDSHDRYIYIHGTAHEDRIGTPDSHGCVRMRNADIAALFDLVEVGTPVFIG